MRSILLGAVSAFIFAGTAMAQTATERPDPTNCPATMAVNEVTTCKDGTAWLMEARYDTQTGTTTTIAVKQQGDWRQPPPPQPKPPMVFLTPPGCVHWVEMMDGSLRCRDTFGYGQYYGPPAAVAPVFGIVLSFHSRGGYRHHR